MSIYWVTIPFAYLIGSIPFGLILTKFAGLGDIRAIGSGNIGATNVLRTGNKKLALLTLLLDGGKGAVAVFVAQSLQPDTAAMAGLFALLGHLFPVWLKFKGGKGVATMLGISLALAWPIGLLAILTWLLVAFSLRYSSLSALVAVALSPIFAQILGYQNLIWLFVIFVAIIFYKHADNIKRLMVGAETKINFRKSGGKPKA